MKFASPVLGDPKSNASLPLVERSYDQKKRVRFSNITLNLIIKNYKFKYYYKIIYFPLFSSSSFLLEARTYYVIKKTKDHVASFDGMKITS